MHYLQFNSLRKRYAVVSAVLVIILLGVAALGYENVSSARKAAADNLNVRAGLLQRSRYVRDAIWRAYKSLSEFVLDPARQENPQRIHALLSRAKRQTSALTAHPAVRSEEQREALDNLIAALDQLKEKIDYLVDTRLDAARQYPSLGVSNVRMAPNRREFNNAMTIALQGVGNEVPAASRTVVYREVNEVRHLWTQMVSDYRLYLANRLGSFNETSLPVQEQAVSVRYVELRSHLQQLDRLDAAGGLGFETGAAVDDMLRAADGWYSGFLEVQVIHASDRWRADAQIFREQVDPRLRRIWDLLFAFDISVEQLSGKDADALALLAENQLWVLWLITAIGVVAVVAALFSLERLVLRPVAGVAEALKAEALGRGQVQLPAVKYRETGALVDAFAEMRKQVHNRQMALEYQAMHDGLTGLANRSLLLDRLEQAIHRAHRDNTGAALLLMDLDRFKEVNDTLGHHVGDRLLCEVALRLQGNLRETDTVARLGGDEFAILAPESNRTQAGALADKVLDALQDAFDIDDLKLYTGASIGVAVYPDHGEDPRKLIQRADVAMYVAKRNRSGYALYDPEADQHSLGRFAMIGDLRDALGGDRLQLYYQPVLRIPDRSVVSVEALLRWQHPVYGWIPPEQLIPVAEQTGLINSLTDWLLERALRQCRAWHDDNIRVGVSINLSVHNLQNANLVEGIRNTLQEYGLAPELLTLEITESTMMANPVHAAETLDALDAMGVRIAIDDFGTGFSSLAYLKQLPVDEIKIDKSFVIDMMRDANDKAIVRSTIDLAHNLALGVVAEGVETDDAWQQLVAMGCDTAQGNFFAEPGDVATITAWLRGQGCVAN